MNITTNNKAAMKQYNKIIKPLSGTVLVFLISLLAFTPAYCQTQKPWQWVRQLGGESLDGVSGIARDSKNNIYIAGSYLSMLKSGNSKIRSAGNMDLYIARLDENGGIKDLWSGGGRSIDQATCLAVSPSDMVIVGGLVSDTIALGKLKDAALGPRLFVASVSSRGKAAWITTLSITGSASMKEVACDKTGNIYVLGSFSGELSGGDTRIKSVGRNDLFVARLSPAGALLKLLAIGGEQDDIPGALAVSDSGQVVVSGQGGKSFQLGSFAIAGSGVKPRASAFMAGLNTNLEVRWTKEFRGEEYATISALAFDNDQNLYAGGNFNFRVATPDTAFTSKGYSDVMLFKYSPAGKQLWGRSTGSSYYDYVYHVMPDALGGVYLTGSLGDTLQIDSVALMPTSQENASLILQLDTAGRVVWGDYISGSGRTFSSGAILDTRGNLYMTGSFRNDFEKEGEAISSYGDQDVFVAKYYNCAGRQAEIKGPQWLCPGDAATLNVGSGYKKVVWNDSIRNTSYINVTAPGTYHVSMYDKRGCQLSGSVTLSRVPSPGLDLGRDTTLWACDSVLLKAPAGFEQYRWSDRSLELTCLATAPDGKAGTYPYGLTVTDSLHCSWSDTILVTFQPVPGYVDLDKAELVSYPNPATDAVYWYLKVEAPCRIVAELTDEHGRTYFSQAIATYMPGEIRKIDLTNLPMGPYHIRVKSPGALGTVKTLRIIKR
jgi:hypothetical protein